MLSSRNLLTAIAVVGMVTFAIGCGEDDPVDNQEEQQGFQLRQSCLEFKWGRVSLSIPIPTSVKPRLEAGRNPRCWMQSLLHGTKYDSNTALAN